MPEIFDELALSHVCRATGFRSEDYGAAHFTPDTVAEKYNVATHLSVERLARSRQRAISRDPPTTGIC